MTTCESAQTRRQYLLNSNSYYSNYFIIQMTTMVNFDTFVYMFVIPVGLSVNNDLRGRNERDI